MNKDEANRIIAEYMGLEIDLIKGEWMTPTKDRWWNPIPKYTKSLDALVPVWKKLIPAINGTDCFISMDYYEPYGKDRALYFFAQIENEGIYAESESKSPQEAAAICTAKAIKELNAR